MADVGATIKGTLNGVSISNTFFSDTNNPTQDVNQEAQLVSAVAGLSANPALQISAGSIALSTGISKFEQDRGDPNTTKLILVSDALTILGDALTVTAGVAEIIPGGQLLGVGLGVSSSIITAAGIEINNYSRLTDALPTVANEIKAEINDKLQQVQKVTDSILLDTDSDVASALASVKSTITLSVQDLYNLLNSSDTDQNPTTTDIDTGSVNLQSGLGALYQASGATAGDINTTQSGSGITIGGDLDSSGTVTGTANIAADGSATSIAANNSLASDTFSDRVFTENVQNSDGTSTIAAFYQDGSSDTKKYSADSSLLGPGSGYIISDDLENADGTSVLTNYENESDGGYTSTSYSGSNGTGSILEATAYGKDGMPLALDVTVPSNGIYQITPTKNTLTITGIAGQVNEVVFPIYTKDGTYIQIAGLGNDIGRVETEELQIIKGAYHFEGQGYFVYFAGANHLADPSERVTESAIQSGDANIDNGEYYYFENSGDTTLRIYFEPHAVACYLQSTLLLTRHGDRAVEDLVIGDQLITYSDGAVAERSAGFSTICWIGHRSIDCQRHSSPRDVWPVRVQTNAFGNSLPRRDLFLSPDHAVYTNGVLIPIKHLINGTTIVQEEVDEVTYYHVELSEHSVILAEGLPCESYLPTATTRQAFANGGGAVQMHPNFAPEMSCEVVWETSACAPLRIEGEVVTKVAENLHRRAAELGYQPCEYRRQSRQPQFGGKNFAGLLQPEWYLATHCDVAAVGIDAVTHYVDWVGRQEGRLPCPEVDLLRALCVIDSATLPFTMPDVIQAGADPVEHFCAIGWREHRRPNPYFDTKWYLATVNVPENMNPLLHYLLLGENQGQAPSVHFDPAWYRRRYAIGRMESPLAHYLEHRRTQRFSPLPSFDVLAYCRKHATTLLPGRDPYAHFLAIGQSAASSHQCANIVAA